MMWWMIGAVGVAVVIMIGVMLLRDPEPGMYMSAWLNEGLATALETGDLGWAEKQAAAQPPVPLRALQSGFGRFTGGGAACVRDERAGRAAAARRSRRVRARPTAALSTLR